MSALNKQHCIVLNDGKFDTEQGTTADDLSQIFKTIGESKDTSIVVHFHGGLIDKLAGIDGANILTPIYQKAGAYPIFFVWESGWSEILHQNLPAIFSENIFKRIRLRVTQFARGKVGKGAEKGVPRSAGTILVPSESTIIDEISTPSDAHEPFANVDPHSLPEGDALTDAESDDFKKVLQDDLVLKKLAEEISASLLPASSPSATARGATSRGATKTLMSPEALDEITVSKTGRPRGAISTVLLAARVAMVLGNVIQRFATRRDHGFYPTIVEEILRGFYIGNAGRKLWDEMKKDTIDAFGVAEGCGGTRFITELETLWKSGKRPRITLVGHSAGAIYACRLLQKIQARGLPPDLHVNLILIAPACDFDLMSTTLQEVGSRIDGLRIFGLGDALERGDAIAGILYPSSLLYFVSGVLEDKSDHPLVGMERFYAAPYDNAEQFSKINFVRKYVHFQKAHVLVWALAKKGDGLNCDMTSHGGWAGTEATVASVSHILQKGYGDG
jgi:hypothetical protein